MATTLWEVILCGLSCHPTQRQRYKLGERKNPVQISASRLSAVTDSFLSRLLGPDQTSQLLLPHHLLGGNMGHTRGWGFICPQSNHCRLSLVVSGERLTRKVMNIIHVKGWHQGSLGPFIYPLQLQGWWRAPPGEPPFRYLNWSIGDASHPACLVSFPYPPALPENRLIFILLFPALWPCQLQHGALSHFSLHSVHPFQPSQNPVTPMRIKLISESFASCNIWMKSKMNLGNPDGIIHISMKVNISMRLLCFFFPSFIYVHLFFFPYLWFFCTNQSVRMEHR